MQPIEPPTQTLWVVHHRHTMPHWVAAVLVRVRALPGLSLRQLSVAELPPTRHHNTWNQLINALDNLLFPAADSASRAVATSTLPDDLFAQRAHVEQLGHVTSTHAGDDWVLNATSLPDADVAAALGATVLSVACGESGGPPGLHESLEQASHTALHVVRTPPGDIPAEVLASATECTDPASIGRTRNAALWAGAELLRHTVEAWVDGKAGTVSQPWNAPRRRAPSAVDALLRMPLHIHRGVTRKWRRRGALRQWILLAREGAHTETGTASEIDFGRWQRILPPRDVFWADPFPVERDGTRYVFIEEATFTPRRGHLSVLTLSADGQAEACATILKTPYHLSYPNVFRHGGEWYMMPESGEDKTLQIYRCTAWPDQWAWQQNVLEGIAVYDGTLLEHGGRWWLFATVQHFEAASPNVFLHLWYADSPFGPWQPHAANPIVSDVRSARPAGQFFEHEGVLYRPSQDCSTHYGHGLRINRVDQLDLDGYRETAVTAHAPWAPDIDGVHTVNRAGAFAVADAIHWRGQAD